MSDAFDDLLRAMKRARDALYNGFEPDNQSRAYHDADKAIKVAGLARPSEAVERDAALDEVEKLIGAMEGRHFAAIETATSEEDKRRHGTKTAFAMELRAAIRALKRHTDIPQPPEK